MLSLGNFWAPSQVSGFQGITALTIQDSSVVRPCKIPPTLTLNPKSNGSAHFPEHSLRGPADAPSSFPVCTLKSWHPPNSSPLYMGALENIGKLRGKKGIMGISRLPTPLGPPPLQDILRTRFEANSTSEKISRSLCLYGAMLLVVIPGTITPVQLNKPSTLKPNTTPPLFSV